MTWPWMKPVECSQAVWSQPTPTVCPYSAESHRQTSGERWQVVWNGNGKLRMKAPTQWTSRSCATPEITEQLHQMHWGHQHDGESCSPGAMERTTRAPRCQCTPNISGQPGRLRTQVGRSRLNILKSDFQTNMKPVKDLTMANGIAIRCARHWEGMVWPTCDSWWKDKNDDDTHDDIIPLRKIVKTKLFLWTCHGDLSTTEVLLCCEAGNNKLTFSTASVSLSRRGTHRT